MKRFEYLEHTADVLIRAYGDNLAEAFAAAADAMFDIITGHRSGTSAGKAVLVEVEANDEEALLVRFLSELIVRHEVDRVIMSDFSVEIFAGYRLKASAHAEKFVDATHAGGTHIKGVPYHLLEIRKEPSGTASVRVLFDI
jgi:SHS2 domain-containing protein